jgi:chromate transporter
MRELFSLFLRLGFTAFGGPAAHIAMMRAEVVVKRGWLSEQEFLDLLGATNLIPGPNSTEMAHHIGYLRGGWRGMLVAGLSFITPAMLIVMLVAYFYVRFSSLPQVQALFYGIKPVVIAIIAQALWSLGRQALKNYWLIILCMGVLLLYLLGVNEVLLLLGAGLLFMLFKSLKNLRGLGVSNFFHPIAPLAFTALAAEPFSLAALFLIFLKIGAVLYGSGYVLLAFLRADFVDRLGWLTDRQLLDAVAIGQFTPGPLFTTATFIGYILGGVPAALLATVGIFLPSFIFVLVSNPWITKLRESGTASAFLDGVNASAFALMAVVTWQLGLSSIVDLPTIALAVVALILLIRLRVNSAWLVLGGGVAGLFLSLLVK